MMDGHTLTRTTISQKFINDWTFLYKVARYCSTVNWITAGGTLYPKAQQNIFVYTIKFKVYHLNYACSLAD